LDKDDRIEKIVRIINENAPSEKYPNYGCSIEFIDEDNIKYEWNTITYPNKIAKNQKWKARMTIEKECNVLGIKYYMVKRVFLIKQL